MKIRPEIEIQNNVNCLLCNYCKSQGQGWKCTLFNENLLEMLNTKNTTHSIRQIMPCSICCDYVQKAKDE